MGGRGRDRGGGGRVWMVEHRAGEVRYAGACGSCSVDSSRLRTFSYLCRKEGLCHASACVPVEPCLGREDVGPSHVVALGLVAPGHGRTPALAPGGPSHAHTGLSHTCDPCRGLGEAPCGGLCEAPCGGLCAGPCGQAGTPLCQCGYLLARGLGPFLCAPSNGPDEISLGLAVCPGGRLSSRCEPGLCTSMDLDLPGTCERFSGSDPLGPIPIPMPLPLLPGPVWLAICGLGDM